MKRRFLLTFFGIALSASCLMAQQKAISGKVSSAKGDAIGDVTVVVKGTNRSVKTNADGSFTIQAAPGEILIFKSIGTSEESRIVGTGSSYNVVLADAEEAITEVVVTAMGIKKEKKALGYAVQDIKADELMKNKSANVVNSLAGKIAGVNVTQSSGAAGAGAQIILRGGTSLERDNQPLFVVDGVIYDNSTVLGGNSGFDGAQSTATSNSNRIMDVNPEDIENVSVLKGPAAAALYGSRAAAGAVIITTKKGKEGRAELSFSSRASNNWVNRLPEQQNKYKRGYYNAAGLLDTYTTQSWGEEFGANETMYDNIKDFFNTSTVYDNNVSLAGGNANSTFYLSASRFDQTGIVPNTGYDKTTFRFNGDQKYGRLTLGANVAYSLANTDKTLTSAGLYNSGGTGAMTSVYRWSRNDDMRKYLNEDGTKYRMFEGLQNLQDDIENPYWTINKNILGDKTERFTGSLNANVNIFDWWNVVYRVGTDSYLTNNSTLISPQGAVKELWQNGMMSESDYKFNYWSSNLMSNFQKKVGDFDLGALVGFFSEQTNITNDRRMGYDFVIDNFYSFENIVDANEILSVNHSKKRLFGLYGELRASYKDMLFLTATGRNDWTSTLPVANRSYFYPSIGGSFVFTELTKDHLSWLNFGKLRASWARVGKDAAPYVTNTYLWSPKEMLGGFVGTGNNWQRGNPYLKPENTTSFEIGAELRFFGGRLGLDYAYYTNNSYNQILSPRLGQSTGYIFVSVNAGDIYNKGMELSLTGKPIVNKNFTWESTINMSGNRGTVDNLLTGVDILYVTDVQVGNAKAASFNGGKFMGISGSKWSRTEDGTVILDANTGMPTSDNLTTYAIGNREPKLTGGFNNSLQYKNFNFSFLFDFRVGGDIYNGTDYFMTINGMSKRSMERDVLTLNGAVNTGTAAAPVYEDKTFTFEADKFYDQKGTLTSGRKIIQDYWSDFYTRESANFMTNTNWLRLRSVSLSYNFADELVKSAGLGKVIKGATATLTGTNLWLLTNYKGMDPETSAAGSGIVGSSSVGIDYNGVPSTAGVAFGINLKF